jgi:Skp family chaperone for outer membrane proteins
MRKHFIISIFTLLVATTFQAQTRGTKIGYIDMEYILQNVPDYKEAQNQLEQKAQKWKQEVEVKKNEIDKLKEALKAEKALLTNGLIEERMSEITFLENEMLDFQQKRFGPYGDLMTQKAGLTKPIQDQVFAAIQDIAEAKKYDFIFDKTSDLTMLFAAKRFDISDQIIRVLNRADKREQLTKKQLAAEEAKEAKQDAIEENPSLSLRQKSLDEKKLARDKALADRALLQEQKKKEAEDRRNQILADREAKKSGSATTTNSRTTVANDADKDAAKIAADEAKQKQLDERAKTLEDRKKVIEENKKAAEERRLKILADREAKKASSTPTATKTTSVTSKVAEPEKNGTISESSIINDTIKAKDSILKVNRTPAEIAKQELIEKRAKTLEERKKQIEENKKAIEEKRKKILQEREDAKKAKEEQLKQ